MDFRNSIFKNFNEYTPGEQPDTADWIKLNTNEFPYSPSPKALKILAELSTQADVLRKYSHPFAEPLRKTISSFWNFSPEQVLVTNGSDEALILACRVFLDENETAAFSEITYSLYKTLVASVGKSFEQIPCVSQNHSEKNLMGVDLNALENSHAKIIFLPNPNAPTGEFFPPEKLAQIIQKSKKLWFIDEAYNDFVDRPNASFIPFLKNLPNAVVVRTFSKSYALAGMRLGYAVSANKKIMQGFYAAKDSYNVDAVAARVGLAAFEDNNYFKKTTAAVIEQREKMADVLRSLNFFVIPSQANFLLTSPPLPHNGKQLLDFLREQKILVRYFSSAPLKNFVRISIGSPEQNNIVLKNIKEFLSA